ncbi:hypothetical protein [Natronomonas halophila]|nr:hypothetical protein [Natronomonas halophila]
MSLRLGDCGECGNLVWTTDDYELWTGDSTVVHANCGGEAMLDE